MNKENVTPAEWVRLLQKEYLADFIAAGGAAVKIAVVLPQQRATTLAAVASAANDLGYLTICVDAADTRIHMIDQLFFAIARQVDWDAVCECWLRVHLPESGIAIDGLASLRDMQALADANGRDKKHLLNQVERVIANEMTKDYALCKEFRTAASMMSSGYVNPSNVSSLQTETLKQWLRGEKCNLTALKQLQIYQKIGRHNARLMLRSLAIWLCGAGYAGLTLLVDLDAVVTEATPGTPSIRYARNAVLDTYELLRQFIDETDETANLLLVAVAGPGLINDDKRNIDNYDALKLRVSNEVRDKNRANPLNTMVRFDLAQDGGNG